jgi:hypothetical protein
MSFIENHKQGKEFSDDGEIINLCSIGLNRIINKLAYEIDNPKKIKYNLFLVNIETFIRNNYEPDISNSDWLNNIYKDIYLYTQYIYEYTKTYKDSFKYPLSLILYFPFYLFQAPYKYQTESKAWHAIQKFKLYFDKTGFMQEKENIDHLEVTKVRIQNNGFKIPNDLIKTIRKHTYTTQYEALMLSHIPVDYHLHRNINHLTLIESYTSELKKWSQFGKKVFKVDHIPFNQYTHVAFGDKVYLHNLVKGGKVKKSLVKRAEASKWYSMTEGKIMTQLSQYVPYDILLKGRFY